MVAADRAVAKQRPVEEAQVVTVLKSSRYAGLSPKQLVLQLADEGLFWSRRIVG